MSFTVGDHVEWTSRVNGIRRTKRGTVLRVVPAGEFAATSLQVLSLREEYNTSALTGDHSTREHESYIVKVLPAAGSKATPLLYWPRVSVLRKTDRLSGA